MKKAGSFKYKKVAKLPADSHPINTRYYLMTNRGNFWAPPFEEGWQTSPVEIKESYILLNVFVVRLDLDLATRCDIGSDTELFIGETIAFGFPVPRYSRKLTERPKGPKGDSCLRRSAGQSRAGVRFVHRQDGTVAVCGVVRDSRSSDGTKRRHNVDQLLPQARSNAKTLRVRPDQDETPDS